MRAREFMTEGVEGKVSKRFHNASPGAHKIRDIGGYDRVNHLNRFAMAMASADGKSSKPIEMDAYSWAQKYNTVHPYTEAEHNMVHQAMATVPTEHHEVVPFSKSVETDDTHKVSPFKAFKGYKRK